MNLESQRTLVPQKGTARTPLPVRTHAIAGAYRQEKAVAGGQGVGVRRCRTPKTRPRRVFPLALYRLSHRAQPGTVRRSAPGARLPACGSAGSAPPSRFAPGNTPPRLFGFTGASGDCWFRCHRSAGCPLRSMAGAPRLTPCGGRFAPGSRRFAGAPHAAAAPLRRLLEAWCCPCGKGGSAPLHSPPGLRPKPRTLQPANKFTGRIRAAVSGVPAATAGHGRASKHSLEGVRRRPE